MTFSDRGILHPLEHSVLSDFARANNVSEGEHEHVVQSIGWSLHEFERGVKHDAVLLSAVPAHVLAGDALDASSSAAAQAIAVEAAVEAAAEAAVEAAAEAAAEMEAEASRLIDLERERGEAKLARVASEAKTQSIALKLMYAIRTKQAVSAAVKEGEARVEEMMGEMAKAAARIQGSFRKRFVARAKAVKAQKGATAIIDAVAASKLPLTTAASTSTAPATVGTSTTGLRLLGGVKPPSDVPPSDVPPSIVVVVDELQELRDENTRLRAAIEELRAGGGPPGGGSGASGLSTKPAPAPPEPAPPKLPVGMDLWQQLLADALLEVSDEGVDKRVKALFESIDDDHGGTLSRREVASALRSSGIQADETGLANMMKVAGVEFGSKGVTLKHFEKMAKQIRALAKITASFRARRASATQDQLGGGTSVLGSVPPDTPETPPHESNRRMSKEETTSSPSRLLAAVTGPPKSAAAERVKQERRAKAEAAERARLEAELATNGEYDVEAEEPEGTWAPSKWLGKLGLAKVITKALRVPAREKVEPIMYVRKLSRDDVHNLLSDANLSGLTDCLMSGIEDLRAVRAASSQELNDKFATSGKFQMSYFS